MAVNEHRGEVALTLGGQEIVLRPAFQSIATIEAQLGPCHLVARRVLAQNIGLADVVHIILCGHLEVNPKADRDAIGQAVFEAGYLNFLEPVGRFLFACVTGGRAPPPGKDQPAKRKGTRSAG